MRQTTHCVACQTPISVGEPTCWACGIVQARPAPTPAPAAAVQSSDPYHRPCPRCRHSVAVYHQECKNCGYALGRSTHTLPTELPSGWEATPLADGTTALRQVTWNRANHAGRLPSYVLTLAGLGYLLAGSTHIMRRAPAEFLWISLLPYLIAAVILVVCLVWLTLGAEYWRVAPGLLEVHKECLGRKWGPRFMLAELSIRVTWRTGRIRRYPVYLLVARELGKEYVLSESHVSDALQLQALGSYLSAQTGWPLQLPIEWPPTPGLWGLF